VKETQRTIRPTELRNPRSRGLDRKSTRDILRIINREDAEVARAVAREIPVLVRAVDVIVGALKSGGRLIYVGAGTSGRLATLDAAEIPPTFGVSVKLVQAVIAGGRRALTDAVEGAEDSLKAGARDLRAKRVMSRDVVVGITASGTTPYVLGALKHARRCGAMTIALTANRGTPAMRVARIAIAPQTGPEVVTGSTRMKAGTAQKMVLNMLSTATMVRLGRVYDNWMIGVAQTNRKLRARGARILQEATGASVSESRRALRQAGDDVGRAMERLKKGLT